MRRSPMAAGPGAGEQENGNAPNFYKLLRPLLQRQQPSRCARARISGQSLVTSNYNLRQGGRWGGGSQTQPPARTSHATPLRCTQGWHRDISCPQICPFGMGSSGALHPSSCPGPGHGAHLDPSPSRSVPDHPSPAPSATWQDQQPQGRGHPSRTVYQNPLPSSQPSKNSFRIAFEAPSPRKLPTALQAATSPSAAAFPVTQRETQQL